MLDRKTEIGKKFLKNLRKTYILLLNSMSCVNNNSVIIIDENKLEKSGNFKFLFANQI